MNARIYLLTIILSCLALFGCNKSDQLKQIHAHYVSIDNGQIEYYRFGSGPPIVLIPGYATDVSSWNKKFLTVLAEHHEVILFNNRNVGGSVIRSHHYECRDLANDTYELIKKLNLKKPAVLGISMGGMIAQQLGVLHPHELSELILINTTIAGTQAVHPTQAIQKRLINMPEGIVGRYLRVIELFFPPAWRVKMGYDVLTDRFIPKNYVNAIPGAALRKQQQQLVIGWVQDNETAKKLAQLSLPVLVLNGEADIVIPPKNSQILARAFTNALLVRWKDGGHAMIYQFPVQIADTITNFMANQLGNRLPTTA